MGALFCARGDPLRPSASLRATSPEGDEPEAWARGPLRSVGALVVEEGRSQPRRATSPLRPRFARPPPPLHGGGRPLGTGCQNRQPLRGWGLGCGGGPTGVCSACRAEVGPGRQHGIGRPPWGRGLGCGGGPTGVCSACRAEVGPGRQRSPDRIRTGVTGLRGQRPRPLDDGAGARGGGLEPPTTGPEPAVLPITPPPNKGGAEE